MNILGLSCFYHDAAAVLLQDGDLVAAVEEERFSRVKHDHRFPQHAINYCLSEGCYEFNLYDEWGDGLSSNSTAGNDPNYYVYHDNRHMIVKKCNPIKLEIDFLASFKPL